MIKIEFVHGNHVLKKISDLSSENKLIQGFTSCQVNHGHGVHHGNYANDAFATEKYYTFMLVTPDKKQEILSTLRAICKDCAENVVLFHSAVCMEAE